MSRIPLCKEEFNLIDSVTHNSLQRVLRNRKCIPSSPMPEFGVRFFRNSPTITGSKVILYTKLEHNWLFAGLREHPLKDTWENAAKKLSAISDGSSVTTPS